MAALEVHNYSSYTNHGCRCDICKEANRVTMARYRKRRKEATGEYLVHGVFVQPRPNGPRGILEAERAKGVRPRTVLSVQDLAL